jgi:AmmeMemoRadiSam system protein A
LEETHSPSPYSYLLPAARTAIRRHLSGEDLELSGKADKPRPVFVTLYTRDEQRLRGCIGHLKPTHSTLQQEVMVCAVAAATKDPRMSPVTLDELPRLRLEISILGPEEKVESIEDLEPNVYGIIVRKDTRLGVLLPSIDGVDTPQAQIKIALRKGKITPEEAFLTSRFRVEKTREE